jgi:hypothetical protein
MPDRLSDVINVKDWGALGNNSHNDAPNIQAAIDFYIGQGGGRIFFPAGDYRCTSGLVVGSDTTSTAFVQLIGCGGASNGGNSFIKGPGSGWVISKGTKTYDLIQRVEGLGVAGRGCIKVTGTGVVIRNCSLLGFVCCDASQANGCSILDTGGGGSDNPDANAAGPYVFSKTGVGYYLGNNCLLSNCRTMGSNWITYALSGTGAAIIGASTETTYMAVRVGWKPDPDPSVIGGGVEAEAIACTVQGVQTERQQTSLELYNARGCLLVGNSLTGGHGPSHDHPITNLTWSAGTATATTVSAHNLPVGTSVVLLNINDAPSAWRPTQFTTVTRTGTNTFTYPIAANPGAAPSFSGTGWSWPAQYNIRVRKASECALIANNCTLNASVASVDLDYNGEAIHSNNLFMGTPGGRGWIPPVGKNAAGWKFVHAGIDVPMLDSNPAAAGNPCGTLTFANLPGQFSDPTAQWQGGPFEGQEFDISDGAKSGGGSAGWGDQVQGGGTGKYKVRFDGVWRRIG